MIFFAKHERGPQGQGRRRLTIIGNTTASVVSPPRITRLPTALQPPHSRLHFTPRRRPCVDYPGICRPACPPLSVPPARHPPPARPRRYPRRGDRPTNRDVWQCLCAAGDRGLMACRRPQATVAAAWRPRRRRRATAATRSSGKTPWVVPTAPTVALLTCPRHRLGRHDASVAGGGVLDHCARLWHPTRTVRNGLPCGGGCANDNDRGRGGHVGSRSLRYEAGESNYLRRAKHAHLGCRFTF